MSKLLAAFGLVFLLGGCAVYPNGAIGPAPIVVAPAPYYGGGYGYARPYAYGYGFGGYGYGRGYYGRRW